MGFYGILWDFMGFGMVLYWDLMGFTRPGKRLHFAMENMTIFNGKINYFYGHFQ